MNQAKGWRSDPSALFFCARGPSVDRMIRTTIVAAAVLLIATPAIAQSQQDQLDVRYDRALAAGYKALFLCSAIANAEANGATRSPESVHAWELTGIQAPLDTMVQDMPYQVMRAPEAGTVDHVRVTWAEDMPPRIAQYQAGWGCSLAPIGMEPNDPREPAVAVKPQPLDERSWSHNEAALDAAEADRLKSIAFDGSLGEGSRTTGFVVVKNGEIVLEDYADGFGPAVPQRTWSVAKSIAATLVGAAVLEGEISVDQPLMLGYWRVAGEPRREITIDHLLRMASGRYSDTPGNRTDALYFGGGTVDETATNWPLINKPGTVFRYANNDTLMAVKAIERYLSYYDPGSFFAKLGMHHTIAETDSRGDYILSSQVWSTARDLAKLGQLYLNNGEWEGERLLPENWREYVSAPSGPQPEGRGVGYGASFWLFNQSEGVPSDTFAAMGNRGQFIVIVPSRNIVIVRRGEDPVGSRFDIASFTREVLENLPE